jgi:hypothetical protein
LCLQVDNKDPWNPSPEVRARVGTVLAECHRVLTARGVLLSITFAAPLFRKPLLLVRAPALAASAVRGRHSRPWQAVCACCTCANRRRSVLAALCCRARLLCTLTRVPHRCRRTGALRGA